jgi:hypothetical protein
MAIWSCCVNLVYFPSFGKLCQEKSGNPTSEGKKIYAWVESPRPKDKFGAIFFPARLGRNTYTSESGLPDFSWHKIPKTGENIPNDHKL